VAARLTSHAGAKGSPVGVICHQNPRLAKNFELHRVLANASVSGVNMLFKLSSEEIPEN